MLNEVAPPGWGHTKAEKEKTKPDKPKSKIGGTAAAFKRALDDGRFKGLPGDKTKKEKTASMFKLMYSCLLYTSPSPRDLSTSRMPSSA